MSLRPTPVHNGDYELETLVPIANTAAVVAFIADPAILESLTPNPDEVECIFDHPFGAIHRGTVDGNAAADLVPVGSDWWPLEDEYHVSSLIPTDETDAQSMEERTGSMGAYKMHVSICLISAALTLS